MRRIATYQIETGKPLALHDFVEYHRLEFDDIYQRDTWSRLLVQAGVRADFNEPDEDRLTKGFRRLAHINAVNQLHSLLGALPTDPNSEVQLPDDEATRRFLLMLHFTLWTREWSPAHLPESVRRLCRNPNLLGELRELLECKLARVDEVPVEVKKYTICARGKLQHLFVGHRLIGFTSFLSGQHVVTEGAETLNDRKWKVFVRIKPHHQSASFSSICRLISSRCERT